MGKSSITTPVGVQLPNDIYDVLKRRADVRGVSLSKYAVMILADWKARGYPAIDTIDSTARAIVMQDMQSERLDPTLNEPLPGEDAAGRLPGQEKRSTRPRKTGT